MKRILINLFLINLSLVLFCSCASVESVAKKITIQSGEIPPDMKTETFVLIGTLKVKNGYDKYLKKEFTAYTGKYILATENEIQKKYSDKNMYRYIMDYKEEITDGFNSDGSRRRSIGFRYYILDRKDGIEYVRKSKSSFFALEIKAYLMAIEAIRKK